MSKRERLQVSRQREKMEKNLGSIAELTRLPSALFIVDIVKEHIAVAEARKLGIPTFAMVDTNSDPSLVDFPIPANDDATKSIELIVNVMIQSITEGLEERKNAPEEASDEAGDEASDEVAAPVAAAPAAVAEVAAPEVAPATDAVAEAGTNEENQ
jgi:small subunit ribosomal protein S2